MGNESGLGLEIQVRKPRHVNILLSGDGEVISVRG